MRKNQKTMPLWAYGVLWVAMSIPVRLWAEKVLVYDEEKGIIFVEKNADGTLRTPQKPSPSSQKPSTPAPVSRPRNKQDIHVGRKKDPPKLYFSSGLQYFKDGDYENALKNFSFADSVDPKPLYALWIGKTMRKMQRDDRMLFIMRNILRTWPESDVADDALFEIAFYYQKKDDLDSAIITYTKLAEQYPFGTSYSNGMEFREIARQQRRRMRAETISTLRILGYQGEELNELIRQFQEAEGLPVTGQADQVTVRAIKGRHRAYLQQMEDASQREERRAHHLFWSLVAIGLFGFSAIIGFFQRLSIRSSIQHARTLKQILSDLTIESS